MTVAAPGEVDKMVAARRLVKTISRHSENWLYGTPAARRLSYCVDPCPKQKFMNVECKTALITGGSSGIGLAIADSLLACGLQKAVIASPFVAEGRAGLEHLIGRHGQGRADFKVLDVTNHKQFEDVYRDVLYKEGNVDILVNNAGIMQDAKWDQTIEMNVKSTIKGILLANKYMPTQERRGGCVINLGSIVSFFSKAFTPVYCGSKHAVVGLTRSFGSADHYSKTGVRTVAMCPGITLTPLILDSSDKQLDKESGIQAMEGFLRQPSQTTPAPGNAAVYLTEYAPPGSLWIIEGSVLSRVTPPNYKSYLKKVADL